MPVFAKFTRELMKGEIDLENDTIKLMLLTNSHTTDQATQEFISSVSANQASVSGGGSGYTAGGATLASKTVTANTGLNRTIFDCADITFAVSGGTLTARYAAIYKDTGTPGTSPIIQIIDFGTDKSATDANFLIQINANGLFYFQGV